MTHLYTSLKHLFLALVLLLIITACEKDPLHNTTTPITTQEVLPTPTTVYATHKIVNPKDVPQVTQAFYTALNLTNTHTTALGPIIYELSQLNGTKTYSTLIRLKNTNAHTFYNIAVQQTSDQTLGKPVIIAYQTQMPAKQVYVHNLDQTGWEITYHYNTTQFIRTNPVVGVTPQTQVFKNGTMGKTDPDKCPDSTTLSLPSGGGGLGFTLTTDSGDDITQGFGNNPPLGNSSGSGGGGTITVTANVCLSTVTTTTYSCNGPNAHTPHPAGPNGGGEGDNSCGDASTDYGGSGSKPVVVETCIPIAVTIPATLAVIPGYDTYPLHEGLITIMESANPCELAEMRDRLNAKKHELNTIQLDILEALNVELASLGSAPCLGGFKNTNDTITLPTLGKSGLESIKTPGLRLCPKPIDAIIMLPVSTYDLLNLLNTISLNYDGLTEAQKAWILDPDNQLEVDNIIDFLDEHGATEDTKNIVKAAIEAIEKNKNLTFEDVLIFEWFEDDSSYGIDISKLLDCFNNIESFSSGTKYSLTIYIEQPVPNTTETYTGTDPGHTFISMTTSDPLIPENNITQVFGFYPKKSVNPLTGKNITEGEFRDNSGHNYHVSATVSVNNSMFYNIINYIDNIGNSIPSYDLQNYNCTDFGINVANLAGMGLPDTTGSWSFAGVTLGSGSNPGNLGQDTRNLSNPNVIINQTGGSMAPSGKGKCE